MKAIQVWCLALISTRMSRTVSSEWNRRKGRSETENQARRIGPSLFRLGPLIAREQVSGGMFIRTYHFVFCLVYERLNRCKPNMLI